MDHPKIAVQSAAGPASQPPGGSGGPEHDRSPPILPVLGPALGIAAFAGLILLERRRPLRRRTEPQLPRAGKNLAMAAAAALVLRLVEKPVVEPLARTVEERRWGLLKRLGLPRWLETLAAVALMDYTLFVWHVLMHRAGWLWRSHLVHHTDLDLDTTTALRFHFGELIPSVVWRALQVVVIGVSPRALRIWQIATSASVAFHHSNLRMPAAWERRLLWLIVTPRMHGIHHSVVKEETNSNWSSGLTLWDRLHGTLRLDVPQEQITIGVPAYRDPADLSTARILLMPFRRQRPTWRWSGQRPDHSSSTAVGAINRPARPL
jgi:sterol desaturase/sphingolipid hydroxylase (fatty acid hydroxylase superfamily)